MVNAGRVPPPTLCWGRERVWGRGSASARRGCGAGIGVPDGRSARRRDPGDGFTPCPCTCQVGAIRHAGQNLLGGTEPSGHARARLRGVERPSCAAGEGPACGEAAPGSPALPGGAGQGAAPAGAPRPFLATPGRGRPRALPLYTRGSRIHRQARSFREERGADALCRKKGFIACKSVYQSLPDRRHFRYKTD